MFFAMLLLLPVFGSDTLEPVTVIRGQLHGLAHDTVLVVFPQDPIESFKHFGKVVSDENGNFEVSYPFREERPVWLYFDGHKTIGGMPDPDMFYLWIKPGSSIFVDVPNDSTMLTKGGAASENGTLRTMKLNSWNLPVDYRMDSFEVGQLFRHLDSLQRARTDTFEAAAKTNGFSAPFRTFAKTEITFSNAKDKLQYLVEYTTKHNLKLNTFQPPSAYQEFLSSIQPLGDSAFYSLKYRNFFSEYFDYIGVRSYKKTANSYTLHLFRLIDSLMPTQPRTRLFLKTYYLRMGLSLEQNMDSLTEAWHLLQEEPGFDKNDYFTRQFAEKSALNAGAGIPDIALEDTSGHYIPLKSLRGKYLLLDFWGSWCVPCMDEMPYSRSLEEKFKDKNVLFVYINNPTDSKGQWKQTIRRLQLHGIHLKADISAQEQLSKYYLFSAFPFYVLIDPQGHIVKLKEPIRPSTNAAAVLDQLPNKR